MERTGGKGGKGGHGATSHGATPGDATSHDATPGELGLERQFLHAARLSFAQPSSGVQIDVASELPDDLRAALEQAERLS